MEYNTRDKNASINPNCGGGVGLFIDEKYKDYEILSDASIFIPNVYESIWVKIRIKDGQDKIIGNVYRPNTAPLANLSQALEIHNSILENIQNDRVHSKCDIQIIGDFNINILNFETHSQTNDYINSLISRSFIPLITLPTRINNQSATLIDHIWSNKICRQYSAGILINSLSDHFPVFFFEDKKQTKHKNLERITRNINKHTISSFCKILKTTKWTNVINAETPKLAFDSFFETFNSARDMAFPEIVAKPKSNKFSYSPWMTPGLRVSQKRKEKLFAKKIKNPSEVNKDIFRRIDLLTAVSKKRSMLTSMGVSFINA